MRVKRLKHVKKLLAYYKTNYGFREPYQLLVDLTFCQFALMYKINIKDQIPKYIDGESQLFTTSCILEEGKLLGPQLHGAVLVCQQFKLRKCGHANPVPAQDCIKSMIGKSNDNHFFVASQDYEMRKELGRIPGVPLLHIHYNSLVLQKPSTSTVKKSIKIDAQKIAPSEYEQEQITRLKRQRNIVEPSDRRIKRKKIKGVNPLAMKKKKKVTTGGEANQKAGKTVNQEAKKRRRHKKKIATHILEELQKQTT